MSNKIFPLSFSVQKKQFEALLSAKKSFGKVLLNIIFRIYISCSFLVIS